MPGQRASSIVWFRKALRVHDNAALLAACRPPASAAGGGSDGSHGGAASVLPVFVIDPWFTVPSRVGVNRMRFLLESLHDLDRSLQALGSRLLVLRGKPQEQLTQLASKHRVGRLLFERDTEPYSRQRDEDVTSAMGALGVEVATFAGHTLYDLDRLLQLNGGAASKSFRGLCTLVAKAGKPPKPLAAPEAVPPLPEGLAWDTATHGVPSLAELGYDSPADEAEAVFVGGERAALRRMDAFLAEEGGKRAARFEKPKTLPVALPTCPSTTVLSPHLKFGTLSARLLYVRLMAVYAEHKAHSTPPTSLEGQLLWREFYYLVAYATPGFDTMHANPICRQIDWDTNAEHLAAWSEGRTGFPWIDAAMTQLRTQGWIHHLARHAVACFLTRGDLYLSWEHGAKVFDKYLLDADWSLNNGNWMWLSASAFFHTYFRVYSPISFQQKNDKHGTYVRHFLPVLAKMPDKYVYAPWEAPLSVQKAAGCVVGVDYPAPIVDHKEAMAKNMARMKASYGRKKYGRAAALRGAMTHKPIRPWPDLRQMGRGPNTGYGPPHERSAAGAAAAALQAEQSLKKHASNDDDAVPTRKKQKRRKTVESEAEI